MMTTLEQINQDIQSLPQIMKEYLVIFEWAGSNYSAYVPDLPGCISTGKTLDETEQNIQEAIFALMLPFSGRPCCR